MKDGDLLVHATTVSIAGNGVLIRGEAGCGKSHLALTLIRRARQAGLQAGLVADDQTLLSCQASNKLVARCPDAIAGKIEIRPWGIVDIDAVIATAPINLVCDLVSREAEIERVQAGDMTVLHAVKTPALTMAARQADTNTSVIFAALGLPCWY